MLPGNSLAWRGRLQSRCSVLVSSSCYTLIKLFFSIVRSETFDRSTFTWQVADLRISIATFLIKMPSNAFKRGLRLKRIQFVSFRIKCFAIEYSSRVSFHMDDLNENRGVLNATNCDTFFARNYNASKYFQFASLRFQCLQLNFYRIRRSVFESFSLECLQSASKVNISNILTFERNSFPLECALDEYTTEPSQLANTPNDRTRRRVVGEDETSRKKLNGTRWLGKMGKM